MEAVRFRDAEQAIGVIWLAVARIAGLLVWTAIWSAHITLLLAAAVLCWAIGLTPGQLAQAFRELQQSTPVAVLGAAGLSVAAVLSGYAWLLRLLHRKLLAWLAQHAMP